MTDDKIYDGDVGVKFKVDTLVDCSAATGFYLKVTLPGGTTTRWTAMLSPTWNRMIEYNSVPGDMVAGNYIICSYVEWSPASVHTGTPFKVKVLEVFK